jgi:hypothetical protein
MSHSIVGGPKSTVVAHNDDNSTTIPVGSNVGTVHISTGVGLASPAMVVDLVVAAGRRTRVKP